MNPEKPKDKLKFHQQKKFRIPAYALAVLIIVPLLAFAAFYARLSAAPLEVPFVGAAIERAVNRSLGGEYVISVRGAVLEPGSESILALRLADMYLFNKSGKLVGVAPFATAELNILSLGSLQPRANSITFLGPVMVLKWGRTGQVELVPGLVPDQRPPEGATAAPALPQDDEAKRELIASSGDFLTTGLSRALRQAFTNMPVSEDGLTRLEVKNAILRVEHEETGAIWRVAPINFVSSADENERVFEVAASVLEGAKPWTVRGRVSGKNAASEKKISVGVSDLVLASATGPLARFSGIPLNVPMSSHFSGKLTPEGEWQDVVLEADLGRGFVNLGANKEPLTFKGASIEMARENNIWAIRHFNVEVADTILALGGVISPLEEDKYGLNLTATYRAEGEGEFARNLPEATATIQGNVDLATRALDLDKLEVETPDVTLAADASAQWKADGQPEVLLIGTASRLDARDLKAIWPAFVLPDTRGWVYDHLQSGVASDIFYRIGLDGAGKLIREMEAKVAGAAFTYFRDLPPVEGANGKIELRGDLFTATLDSGHVEPVPEGRIDLAGTVWHTRLTGRGVPDLAELNAVIKGDAAPVAYYLDLPALNLLQQNDINISNLAGQVEGTAKLEFPIMKDVPDDKLQVAVSAKLSGFEADGFIPDKRLTDGSFAFTQDEAGITIEGNGKLGGAGLALTAQRGKPQGSQLKYNAVITLDAEDRKNFGIDMNDFLTGPVRAVFSGEGRDLPKTFDIDLTPARIEVAPLGYVKAAGTGAQASVTYREEGEEIVIEDLAYDAGPVSLRGQARVGRNGGLISATLPVFRFQEGDDLSLDLARKGRGYAVDVRGARFNVAPFLDAGTSGSTKGKRDPFSLKASIGAAVGAEGQIIRNVTLSLRHDGEYVRDFSLEGEHAEGGTLRGWQEDLVYHVESLNAGSLLRFTDTYKNMLGGRLQLQGSQTETSTYGYFKVNDFTIINDALVQRIAAADSRNEQLVALRNAAQQGLSFTSLSASYSYGRDKVLTIDDGKVKGPTAGATAEGTINVAADTIALQGTFVPAYAINNVFSKVPIFGRILGGDEDEGLLGINFTVRGTTEKPDIDVQPLSALTPGIFRRIFE